MFFSIIVPIYNSEKYVGYCLESILKQKFADYEVILIDDGSKDNSLAICNKYKQLDKRIKVFSQGNRGQYYARYQGLLLATGKYILFLDSDDNYVKNALQVLYQKLNISSPDILIFNYKRIYPNDIIVKNGPMLEEKKIYNRQEIIIEAISNRKLNNLCNKAIKRNIIEKFKPESECEKLRNGEDLLMSLQFISMAKTIVFYDECLYNYVVNINSVSNRINWNLHNDIRIIYELSQKYAINCNLELVIIKKYLIDVCSFIYSLAISNASIHKITNTYQQIFNGNFITLFLKYSRLVNWNYKLIFYLFKYKLWHVLIVICKFAHNLRG